jgi:hypothetical protein
MPKSKPTQKAVQMEMFPSDKSQRALSSYEAAKKNFETQWIIQNKLYSKIAKKLSSEEQTIAELKQLTDAQRNSATTMKLLIDSLQSTEEKAQDAIAANDYEGIDLDGMNDDDLREFFGW